MPVTVDHVGGCYISGQLGVVLDEMAFNLAANYLI